MCNECPRSLLPTLSRTRSEELKSKTSAPLIAAKCLRSPGSQAPQGGTLCGSGHSVFIPAPTFKGSRDFESHDARLFVTFGRRYDGLLVERRRRHSPEGGHGIRSAR